MTGVEAIIKVVTQTWRQRTRITYCKPEMLFTDMGVFPQALLGLGCLSMDGVPNVQNEGRGDRGFYLSHFPPP